MLYNSITKNNFIISCWDGNIFSLEFSIIDSYLFDKKIGNEKFNNLFPPLEYNEK